MSNACQQLLADIHANSPLIVGHEKGDSAKGNDCGPLGPMKGHGESPALAMQ